MAAVVVGVGETVMRSTAKEKEGGTVVLACLVDA